MAQSRESFWLLARQANLVQAGGLAVWFEHQAEHRCKLHCLQGRLKSAYSVHRKMQRKKVPLLQVYDARALRIMIDDEHGSMLQASVWPASVPQILAWRACSCAPHPGSMLPPRSWQPSCCRPDPRLS